MQERAMRVLLRAWLLLVLVLLLPCVARAAINCTSITTPGVSINYVNNTTTSVQTSFSVTCTRATGDPQSVSYSVKADNGKNFNGVNNNATLGTASLRYDLYTSATCGTQWKGGTTISDTITWGTGITGSITKPTSYWGCMVIAQTASASGTYTDTPTLTLTYNNNQTLTVPVPVAIYAPALCTVAKAPGPINLSYAAFGPLVSNFTTIGVQCTNGMPFTMATDVPEAVLNGLRYTLGISGPAMNGTGTAQTYNITATIPAGQAGTCTTGSCSATRTHTLTITY
jgi:spore coat protein U-like protein